MSVLPLGVHLPDCGTTGNHRMNGNLQQEVNLLNPQSYNNKSLPYVLMKATFTGFASLYILVFLFSRLVCVSTPAVLKIRNYFL